MQKPEQFQVTQLGQSLVDATALPGLKNLSTGSFWVSERLRVPSRGAFDLDERPDPGLGFELAGARKMLYFNPGEVTAGVVTCGGICPGLNDVIRALFMALHHIYRVRKVLGFRYGFRGLDPANGHPPMELSQDLVLDIHTKGGTILGTARGKVDSRVMVDRLRELGVDMLFVVGGDGSMRGAHSVWQAARAVNYPLAVVGVPKTIDNDIRFVYKTFGFDTAVSFARGALEAAHIEAQDNPNGIGLVKLMGRDAGFIAAYATLASINVNYTLVPEVPFDLEGPGALLEHLTGRIRRRGHAVIVVAEGAGQHLFNGRARARDASGNLKHNDIGVFLKERILDHFKKIGLDVNLKYIDPSYMLRSLPSNANDSIFASDLARYAVHAAMAGKTDVMIGRKFNQYIHVPIPLAVAEPKRIDPEGSLWMNVLQATGQPASLRARNPDADPPGAVDID